MERLIKRGLNDFVNVFFTTNELNDEIQNFDFRAPIDMNLTVVDGVGDVHGLRTESVSPDPRLNYLRSFGIIHPDFEDIEPGPPVSMEGPIEILCPNFWMYDEGDGECLPCELEIPQLKFPKLTLEDLSVTYKYISKGSFSKFETFEGIICSNESDLTYIIRVVFPYHTEGNFGLVWKNKALIKVDVCSSCAVFLTVADEFLLLTPMDPKIPMKYRVSSVWKSPNLNVVKNILQFDNKAFILVRKGLNIYQISNESVIYDHTNIFDSKISRNYWFDGPKDAPDLSLIVSIEQFYFFIKYSSQLQVKYIDDSEGFYSTSLTELARLKCMIESSFYLTYAYQLFHKRYVVSDYGLVKLPVREIGYSRYRNLVITCKMLEVCKPLVFYDFVERMDKARDKLYGQRILLYFYRVP